MAAKVFQLLEALKPPNRRIKAAPINVFLLRYRKNLSFSEIARECKCARSLVALRFKAIKQKLPWQPQQLRELSAHVEAMQDALTDSRARKIHPRSLIYGDEDEPEENS
jgi:hypothetical protein